MPTSPTAGSGDCVNGAWSCRSMIFCTPWSALASVPVPMVRVKLAEVRSTSKNFQVPTGGMKPMLYCQKFGRVVWTSRPIPKWISSGSLVARLLRATNTWVIPAAGQFPWYSAPSECCPNWPRNVLLSRRKPSPTPRVPPVPGLSAGVPPNQGDVEVPGNSSTKPSVAAAPAGAGRDRIRRAVSRIVSRKGRVAQKAMGIVVLLIGGEWTRWPTLEAYGLDRQGGQRKSAPARPD